MPEYVRPCRHSFDPTAVARTSDYARDLSGRAEWPKRCLCTQEQMLFGGLRAGQVVMCGSVTRPFWLDRPGEVAVDFGRLGRLAFTFA